MADPWATPPADDPWATPPEEVAPKTFSTGAAAWRGVEKGATAGWRDKIAALAGAAGHMSTGLRHDVPDADVYTYQLKHPELSEGDAKQALIRERFGDPTLGDVYREALDLNRKETEAAKTQHPWAYGGGNVAGGVLLTATPGLGLSGGTGKNLGARVLSGGAAGAKFGALAGAGESRADDLRGTAADALGGAAVGTAAGGAGQLLGEGIKAAAAPVATWLRDSIGLNAMRALGLTKGEIRSALSGRGIVGGVDRVASAGNDLRDLGVASPLVTPAKGLERIQDLKHGAAQQILEKAHPDLAAIPGQNVGEKLGSVLPQLDQQLSAAGRSADPRVNFNVQDVWGRISPLLAYLNRFRGVSRELGPVADDLETRALNLLQHSDAQGNVPFSAAHEIRQAVDEPLFRMGKNPNTAFASGYVKKFRDALSDEIENKVDAASQAVGSGTEGAAWQKLNRLYSSLSIGERVATSGKIANAGNNVLDLRTAMAAMTGHFPLAAAMKVGRHFGSGLAMGAQGMAQSAAEAAPELATFLRAAVPIAMQSGAPVTASAALAAALLRKKRSKEEEPTYAP